MSSVRTSLVVLGAAAGVALTLLLTRPPSGPGAAPGALGASSAVATAAALALSEGTLAALFADAPQKKTWFLDESAPAIELAGRVFLDGKPAPGVTVTSTDELTSEGLLGPKSVVSDGEGRFVLASVPRIRGWYRVAAGAPGAAPAWVTVPGDLRKDDIELRLQTCKMHVYGIVADASGGVVAAARVFLEKVPEHAALSDARGQFQLCAGEQTGRLHVEAEGYGPWLRWVSPRGALRQDVTLIPAASVAGTVVLARGGALVPHALVSLRLSGESIRDVQADEDGHFAIANVAPGSYAIEARGLGARSQHPVNVAVFASAKANVTVPVDTRARVHGHVVSAAGPVAGNAVNLGFNATSEWGTAVRTGEDGAFTIEDAPIGNLLVKVDDHDVEAPRTLRVSEAGLADVTIRVATRGQLLVAVTRQGSPVSDATVFLRGAVASDTKFTNAAGLATFRGLGEPTYRVFTEHENDFAVAERVAVDREKPAKVSLELTAGRQIAGRVVDEQGRAVDGARVSFALASSPEDSGASAISGGRRVRERG